jgi:hypothetical protein
MRIVGGKFVCKVIISYCRLVKSTEFEQFIAYFLMRTFVTDRGHHFLLGTETKETDKDRVGWGESRSERRMVGEAF